MLIRVRMKLLLCFCSWIFLRLSYRINLPRTAREASIVSFSGSVFFSSHLNDVLRACILPVASEGKMRWNCRSSQSRLNWSVLYADGQTLLITWIGLLVASSLLQVIWFRVRLVARRRAQTDEVFNQMSSLRPLWNRLIWFSVTSVESGSKALEFLGLMDDMDSSSGPRQVRKIHSFNRTFRERIG